MPKTLTRLLAALLLASGVTAFAQDSTPAAAPAGGDGALAEENAALKARLAELEELEALFAELEQRNRELETELSTIKKVSANALALQEQNEILIKENRILQSEVDVLTATRDQLSNDNTRKWFLYGAVAVFLGALLAVFIPQLRPRKRFSEWG